MIINLGVRPLIKYKNNNLVSYGLLAGALVVGASQAQAVERHRARSAAPIADIDRSGFEQPNSTSVEEALKSFPRIESKIAVELENDYTTKSDDKSKEINDLYTTTEIETGVYFTKQFSIQSLLVFEPVLDPKPFKDRTFGDHGLYAENLFVQFERGPFGFIAGKFNPSFGIAWDAAPGVYGVDFAEDYEIAERLGGGITLTHEADGSKHVFQANIFRADTTFLSNSAFTKRGRIHLGDGGASNTKWPESFSLTLDGEQVAAMPGFAYHLGVRHQAKGDGDVKNEFGVVVGAQQEINLGEGQSLTLLAEGVHLDNAEAGPDDVFYLTGSGEFITGPWSASVAHTWRHTDVSGASNINDHQTQVSAGYEVPDGPLQGVGFNIGYKHVEEAGVKSHVLGFLVVKEFNISAP